MNDGVHERLGTVKAVLHELMTPGTGLDLVLTEYHRIQDDPERLGLCHDIATAIIADLCERGRAQGWTWCQALVDGGVDHSWVEFQGLRVDMGDNHKLRVSSAENPVFTVESRVVRRDPDETLSWIRQQDQRRTAEAAYFRWLSRGCGHGADLEDWFAAEVDLGLRPPAG